MDKSNGNGLYATGSCHADNVAATTATTTTTAAALNINNIMNGAAAVAAAAAAATLPTSASSEDLSQSLSEYTDADESISAPTEFLAEVSEMYSNANCKKEGNKFNLRILSRGLLKVGFVRRLIDC